jgi:hypothetical protein
MITIEDIICRAFLTDKKPEEIGSTHTLNYYVLSLGDKYDLWWAFSQQIDKQNLLLDCCLLRGDFQKWKSNPLEHSGWRTIDKVMIKVKDFFGCYDKLIIECIDYDLS